MHCPLCNEALDTRPHNCAKLYTHEGNAYSNYPPRGRTYTATDAVAHDPVYAPAHYTQYAHPAIDVIEDWKLDYHLGNTLKYIARHRHKGAPIQDLEKAAWYLEREIQILKKQEESTSKKS